MAGKFLELMQHHHHHPHGGAPEPSPDDEMAMAIFGAVYILFIVTTMCCVFVCGPLAYYSIRVAPTEQQRLRTGVEVPPAAKGRWLHGLFDVCGDCAGFLWSCCCTPCAISDLFLRAGWTHELMGESTTSAQAFFAQYYGLQCCFMWFGGLAKCGFLAMMTFLRSGLSADPSGKVFGRFSAHQSRFQLPEADSGCMHGIQACLTWSCCAPCAAHQELRQVKAALGQDPQQQQPGTVVSPVAPMPPQQQMPMPQAPIVAQVVSVQGPPALQQPLMQAAPQVATAPALPVHQAFQQAPPAYQQPPPAYMAQQAVTHPQS